MRGTNGPRDDRTKPERERQIPEETTYMWNLEYDTNEPIYEAKPGSQAERTDLLPKGRGLGEDGVGVWDEQM